MYESSTKETKWMCIQLACSRGPRAFEEAHRWNIQAKFYNERYPLVYENDKTRDSLSWRSWCYFEAQVWKKDSNIVPSLFFSLFMAFFLGLLVLAFPFLGQCSMNDDHHTSIYLQLNDYNSILKQSMTLYGCLRRCTGICNESGVTSMKKLWTVALPQILCQLHDHAKQYDNDERVMMNGTVESCMAIYLRMAMEMP